METLQEETVVFMQVGSIDVDVKLKYILFRLWHNINLLFLP